MKENKKHVRRRGWGRIRKTATWILKEKAFQRNII